MWTVELREGVTFHDGTPFNAEAVVYNLDRLFASSTCANKVDWADATASGEVVDENTVRITTSAPDPALPLRLRSVTMASPDATPQDGKASEPVGTGPYKLAAASPGTSIVLERNDDYWGDEPQITEVTYVWRTDDSVRANMVKTGEADIATNITPQDATDDEQTQSYPLSAVFFLRLDMDVAPLDDVRVREAIASSIDKESIVNNLMDRTGAVSQQIVTELINGFIPDFEGVAYDPDHAKDLLAEAKADGVPVDVEIPFYNRLDEFSGENEVVQAIVSDLNEIGLNVRQHNSDLAAHAEQFRQPFPEGHPARIVSVASDNLTGDASVSFPTYLMPGATRSALNDPVVADLVERAGQAVGDERAKLYQDAAEIVYTTDYYLVPVASLNGLMLQSERIEYEVNTFTAEGIRLAEVGVS